MGELFLSTIRSLSENVYEIQLSGSELIQLTGSHRLFSVEANQWKPRFATESWGKHKNTRGRDRGHLRHSNIRLY